MKRSSSKTSLWSALLDLKQSSALLIGLRIERLCLLKWEVLRRVKLAARCHWCISPCFVLEYSDSRKSFAISRLLVTSSGRIYQLEE